MNGPAAQIVIAKAAIIIHADGNIPAFTGRTAERRHGRIMDHIRVWSEVDLAEIQNHIITVDDKFGFCPGCREMGIKLEGLKTCPKCGREFKYVTAHESRGTKGFEMIGRIRKKLPHMIFVDFDDYERISGKKKAESLFNV